MLHVRRTTNARGYRWCQLCEAGKVVQDKETCVACGPGKFNDGTLGYCSMCPVDTYQEHSGQTSCTACPTGAVTSGRPGSKALVECACATGSYGTGVDCQVCPVGKYSDRPGLFRCYECPAFRNTSEVDSKSASQCLCIHGLCCYVSHALFLLLACISPYLSRRIDICGSCTKTSP